MIKIVRNGQNNQGFNKQIESTVHELKKDLSKSQRELNGKNKQLNQYDKVLRMTKQEYKKTCSSK